MIRATRAQYEGGYGASWEEWGQVITLNPHNQTAHRNVGKLYYDQGDYEAAMEHFRLGNSPTSIPRRLPSSGKSMPKRSCPGWAESLEPRCLLSCCSS